MFFKTIYRTYFIKRLGSRHARNSRFRPELHVLWNSSKKDDVLNCEFNSNNTLYLKNFSKGIPANILTGTIAGDPATTSLAQLTGNNCMKLILSKSAFKKTFNVSQVLEGTDSKGEAGLYSATLNIDTFSASNLFNAAKSSTKLTILNGPFDVNTRITLKSH